jgi:hypothetical protein
MAGLGSFDPKSLYIYIYIYISAGPRASGSTIGLTSKPDFRGSNSNCGTAVPVLIL